MAQADLFLFFYDTGLLPIYTGQSQFVLCLPMSYKLECTSLLKWVNWDVGICHPYLRKRSDLVTIGESSSWLYL